MIQPPGLRGVVFTDGTDGDLRHDLEARRTLASRAGVPRRWATVAQVHGNSVVRVDRPGDAGQADALWTTEADLAVAVFTADCFGVVLIGEGVIGVAHAGWRGTRAGVVGRLRAEMSEAGHPPERAAVGPGIGPCCFEVGPEVLVEFRGHMSTTMWETPSVDLRGAIGDQLDGLDVWVSTECTHHGEAMFSHRRDGTPMRMAAVGWLG